ncbi:MAG TPA: hypothetical protein VKE94_19260 [Gemmataceae bacterium]|nr:hypothetical protein [Gemmataceae bacterium]
MLDKAIRSGDSDLEALLLDFQRAQRVVDEARASALPDQFRTSGKLAFTSRDRSRQRDFLRVWDRILGVARNPNAPSGLLATKAMSAAV